MKNISVLFMFLLGCNQIINDDFEESYEVDDTEDYSDYSDNEFVGEPKEIPCPTAMQEVSISGNSWKMKIPSHCQREMIDTGRPWQEEILPEPEYNINIQDI